MNYEEQVRALREAITQAANSTSAARKEHRK
jgi:hypothetical protein